MKDADKQYTYGSDAYSVTVDGQKDNGTEIKLGSLVEVRFYQSLKRMFLLTTQFDEPKTSNSHRLRVESTGFV